MPPKQEQSLDRPLPRDLEDAMKDFRQICKQSTAGSKAFEYGSQGYKNCIRHFLPSSSDVAQLAVQPGSKEDLSKMMKVLSDRSTVPFAIKGAGHGMVPGASSTPGIMISMDLFDNIDYDSATQLVKVGAGCLWDQVYAQMYQYRRNVVGGAASQGVGVAGWLLGGGYSLKSNKYGLGIDNVTEYEVVIPSGEVRIATEETFPELFQALRGGGNNFGVVTSFTLKTHPQSLTYGGSFMVPGDRVEQAKLAIADFVENEQRKEAALVSAFRHRLINGILDYSITFMCVYDGPMPSEPVFERFKDMMTSGPAFSIDPAGWESGTGLRPRTDLSSIMANTATSKQTVARVSLNSDCSENTTDAFNSPPPMYRRIATDAPTLCVASLDSASNGGGDPFREMDHGTADAMLANSYAFDLHPARGVDMEVFSRAAVPVTIMAASVVADEELMSDEEDIKYSMKEPEFDKIFPANDYPPIDRPILITKRTDSMGELKFRGRFGCIMVSKYTKPLLDKMAEEAEKAASFLKIRRGCMVMVDAWPFHAEIFKNSLPGAAWPHEPNAPFGPMLAYFLWEDEKDDAFWLAKLKGTLNRIRVVALDLGLTTRYPAYYNNLSLESVPAQQIYRDNMKWLMKVKEDYDPLNVMGRTGVVHRIPLPLPSK